LTLTLRDLRESAKLQQHEVAAACNVTQAAVSRWESGEYPIPRKYWRFFRHLFHVTDDELNRCINDTMKG
jgi:transcriptional regulator with XRE-family HTH domain